MRMKFRKLIAMALAIALVVTTVTFTAGNTLKAEGEQPASEPVTAQQEEQAQPAQEDRTPVTEVEERVVGESTPADDTSARPENNQGDNSALQAEDQGESQADNQAEEQGTEDVDENSDEEDSMPAQSFVKTAGNGITVSVSAPEGAFPEGTSMTVTAVANTRAVDLVEGEDEAITDAKGVDITFHKDGKEIQPKKEISVSLENAGVKGSNFSVYHVADNGSVDKVTDNATSQGASFKADQFSIYIIAGDGATSTRAAKPSSITITGADTVKAFSKIQLTASFEPISTTATVTWTSSNDEILTVDRKGKVTGVSEGEATVTASAQGQDGIITATKTIRVTAPEGKISARFFYLKSPTHDPKSNEVSHWGDCIGSGKVNIDNAKWDDINSYDNVPGRVVTTPSGFTKDGRSIIVPRSTDNGSHWMIIFNAFKGEVPGGNDLQPSDVEKILLHPYKISKNDGGKDYHVDCTVEIIVKNHYTATYYLWDANKTGYEWKAADSLTEGETTQPSGELARLPQEKRVNGVKYRLLSWYDDEALSNHVEFPYEINSNKNFYAKYVPMEQHRVVYDLNGGSWNDGKTATYYKGDSVVVSSTVPVRDGHEFTGWTSSEGDEFEGGETFTMPDRDVTITANWQIKNFNYSIEYYYSGEKDGSKTESGNAQFDSQIDSYVDKPKTGYKFDRVENMPLTITSNPSNNVIKVYYEKDSFQYSIHYFYDGIEDTDKTVTNTAEFGSQIDSYPDKNKTGYKLDEENTTTLPLTIGTNPAENVINVYYEKDSFGYTVEYYYAGVKDEEATVTGEGLYGEQVTYAEKPKTGYVNDRVEGAPLTITEDENANVIKVYYKKGTFAYSVEYYIDGERDSELTERYSGEFGQSVSTYTDKCPEGYKLQKTENLPMNIGAEPSENVIKVYYEKDKFNYTVKYFYDGTEDPSKAETKTVLFGTKVENYEDKNITGYKLQKTENLPLTVGADETQNVVGVYYVKDEFQYTVEYYYDGVIDNNKTENYSALYGEEITTYEDKVKEGYEFVSKTPETLVITEKPNNNVIKVYYEKADFGYRVEYYYDGVIDADKTVESSATFEDVISTYTDKVIEGYKLDKVVPEELTIGANPSENVMKVYYEKDSFQYSVHYFYDGIEDTDEKVTESAVFGTQIDSYEGKNRTGYKLDEENTTALPITVGANPAENVINVYYVKDKFQYTVEYYYDGEKDDSKTVTEKALFGTEINTYPDKNKTGYKLDEESTTALPITIGANPAENVIKVYYVRDNFQYTVHYFYDGVEDVTEMVTDTAKFGSKIDSYTDKNRTGYKLDEDNTTALPITIGVDSSKNVINVYYVKDKFQYTVEYYYDGDLDEEKTETTKALYGSTITSYEEKAIDGYKLQEVKGLPLTVSENPENNVIEVYYVKADFGYTVEYYVDGKLDSTAEYAAKFKATVDEVEDRCPDGYKEEKKEGMPLTITSNPANNLIKVYYVKDSFQYTVDYYYDNVKDDSKTETGTAVFGSEIDSYTDKVKTGYKLQKTENLPLTVGADETQNVVGVYYVKDEFQYTVEYYYDGVIDNNKTENYSALYGTEITAYEDKVIDGYKFKEVEGLPLTVSEKPASNLIKVYYEKDDFDYTVKYFVDGNLDSTAGGKAQFGSEIKRSDVEDRCPAGYRFDKAENAPLTITSSAEANVMSIYYVKDEIGYTVEYYYDGKKDDSKTDTKKALFGSSVSTYTDKCPTGYELEKVVPETLVISANPSNNVMKVYYKKAMFQYTVEYYYGGAKDENATVRSEAEYSSKLIFNDSLRKDKTGYELDKVEPATLTIGTDPAANVMKVYYTESTFEYTVHYFYDGVEDVTEMVTDTAKFGSKIDSYTDKNRTGYKLDEDNTTALPITIGVDSSKNVINVYYVKDKFQYTVEYYYDGDLDEEKTETTKALYGTTITSYKDKAIDGYEIQEVKGLPLTVSEKPANNVIEVYYVKANFEYTVEYYVDGELANTEEYAAKFKATIDEVKNRCPDGYKEEKVEGLPLTITSNPANNLIKVYYVKDSFQYTVDYYYDNVKDDSKTETGTAVFGSEIDSYTDKVKTGYKLESVSNKPLTITSDPEKNVMSIYYVKDDFAYTVEYYYDGEKDDDATYTSTAEFKSEINGYPDKVKKDYKYDKVKGLPLEITSDPEKNVIKVYYVHIDAALEIAAIDGIWEYDGNSHYTEFGVTGEDRNLYSLYYQTEEDGPWYSLKENGFPSVKNVSDGKVAVNVKAEAEGHSTLTGRYTLEITPRVLTVTADDKSKVYGQKNPQLTGTITGEFVLGEDVSNALTGEAAFKTTADRNSKAGTYPITAEAGSLEAVNGNYQFIFVDGILTVVEPDQPLPPDNNGGNNNPGNGGGAPIAGTAMYDLTTVADNQAPLANNLLDTACCILHLLIMLVALLMLGIYTYDMKRRQKKIFELEEILEGGREE